MAGRRQEDRLQLYIIFQGQLKVGLIVTMLLLIPLTHQVMEKEMIQGLYP